MSVAGNLAAKLHRLGGIADVKIRSESEQNAFGNVTDTHTFDREVIAFRTYPNRNTKVESRIGDHSQDRPVFLVPVGDEQPEPPQEGDHLVYKGKEYEVDAHTPYDTHVEFFADPLMHENQGE